MVRGNGRRVGYHAGGMCGNFLLGRRLFFGAENAALVSGADYDRRGAGTCRRMGMVRAEPGGLKD